MYEYSDTLVEALSDFGYKMEIKSFLKTKKLGVKTSVISGTQFRSLDFECRDSQFSLQDFRFSLQIQKDQNTV